MDIFSRFARDPACLLAIDAADGGTWRSPFRSQRSRKNFAGTPTVFADATAALNAVGTGDFDFTVVYNLKNAPAATFGVFYNTSDFGMQVSNAPSYLLRACGVYVFVYQPAVPGAGSYRIRRIGSTIEFYLNGVLVGTKTSSAALSTSNISINLDGTVTSATLTGAASWSASIDQLYNADAIYPSAVPRNFATEPATWYAFDRAQKNIGTDDIEFEIEFYWNYDGAPATNGPIFAAGAPNSAVYLYYQSTGVVSIVSNLLGPPYVIMMLRTAGNPLPRGGHKVVCRVIGTSFRAQLDNEVAMTTTGIRQTGLTFSPQTSNFNGNILSAKLTNLTTGRALWGYPSFEEKTRLITKTNVWTGGGVFEAASSAAVWAVKYAGYALTGDYTAVIDTTTAVVTQVRKSGVTSTYTNGVSGGTLPYLTLASSMLSGAYGTKMRHFLLFDRALSIGEIQLLR